MKSVLTAAWIGVALMTSTAASISTDVHVMTAEDLAEEAYYDELELLACIVHAEAGNQSLYGKQLVADVILNRVDSDDFPDSITEVVQQTGPVQFSTYYNGALERTSPTEEDFYAVKTQVEHRINRTVLYFSADSGWNWEFREGDHYFK